MKGTRECDKCIHYVWNADLCQRMCNSWNCDMKTLEQLKSDVRKETIDEVFKVLTEKMEKAWKSYMENPDNVPLPTFLSAYTLTIAVTENMKADGNASEV